MSRILNVRNLLVAALLASGLSLAGSAQACDYLETRYFQQPTNVYVAVDVAPSYWTTRYDSYREYYRVKEVKRRVIHVQVGRPLRINY